MSRRAPRPLSLALDALTDRLAPDSALARVQRVWRQAAGEAVAAACRPSGARDGLLTVTCAEAVWAQELDLLAADVLARVNHALGEDLLTALRCRIG